MNVWGGHPVYLNDKMVLTFTHRKEWKRANRPPKVRERVWYKPDPTIVRVGHAFVMHPEIWRQVKEATDERQVR